MRSPNNKQYNKVSYILYNNFLSLVITRTYLFILNDSRKIVYHIIMNHKIPNYLLYQSVKTDVQI